MGRRGSNRNSPASIKLEDGTATYMGDGLFVVDTVDDTQRGKARFQRTVLSAQSMVTMLAMAA